MATNTNTEDVRELPAYGIAEAAHYLLIPRATLRSWLAGMSYRTGFFKPVIEPAAKSPLVLSFVNLTFSLAALDSAMRDIVRKLA